MGPRRPERTVAREEEETALDEAERLAASVQLSREQAGEDSMPRGQVDDVLGFGKQPGFAVVTPASTADLVRGEPFDPHQTRVCVNYAEYTLLIDFLGPY